jgi:Galactose oxidase-like, Early set domain
MVGIHQPTSAARQADAPDGHVHVPADQDFPHLHGPPPAPDPGDPGPGIRGLLEGKPGLYLAERPVKVTVEGAGNPAPHGSFGYVDRFVAVRAGRGEFPKGKLVVGVDREGLRTVDPETLRVFRWDEKENAFEPVFRSGPGQTRDYVWAEVSEPGLYGVIGVDGHPLVARTIGLLGYLEGLLALDEGGGLQRRVCELILCSPDMQALFADPEALARLAEDNHRLGLPGLLLGYPDASPRSELEGGICETCIGLPKPRRPVGWKPRPWLPELELLPHICLTTPSRVGRWEVRPEPAGVLAVHAGLLRTGKVVYFGGSENVESQHTAGGAGIDNTRLWDPATGNVQTVPSPANHDLFCCGHAFLADGRLLAAGGTEEWAGVPVGGDPHGHAAASHFRGLASATRFDPGFATGSNPWASVKRMSFQRGTGQGGGRWYPTLLTLPDGRVLAMSGHPEDSDTRHNNVTIEAFSATPATQGTWSDEGDQPLVLDGYPRLHVVPGGAQGKVLCTTLTDGQSWTWDPAAKVWVSLGTGPGADYAGYGTSSVLLPLLPGNNYQARVLVTNAPQARILDLGASTPTWQNTAARAMPGAPWRYHATAILLADGSVLVVGGLSNPNSNASAHYTPERFDSVSGTWTTVANASAPRVYHSVALLLPDGTVWAAGSDYGAGNHEMRMEIYSPPYLFWGPRPRINQAPATITPGGTFTMKSPDARQLTSTAIVRCGTSTHAFNPDQRYVVLPIHSRTGANMVVAAPPSHAVAPPGYYLLFAIDDAGVPSVGRFVRVT